MVTHISRKTAVKDQEIAAKAYELYLSRGGEHGHDLEDWLAAESELKTPAKRKSAKTKSAAKD